eukprot:TRINITY_DN8481_c0_g1_i1.p1 TRINITY_DN8481_c0_g1~~TRINITY_DN8481_c0_g1_i1.p1  ORF type:complete len:235 (+),score=55.47 TRINITY_DN8481_c0_g1_i1:924-1628(+)
MWSIGCILVEMMTRQTPFPGSNENHQMDHIFKMVGSPVPEVWGEELINYPGYKTMRKGLYAKNQIRTVFKDWDNQALDFLERLWSPPSVRITAKDALVHPFFTSDPLPCDPSSLPKVPSVHEYEVKKRRMEGDRGHQGNGNGNANGSKRSRPNNGSAPPNAPPAQNGSRAPPSQPPNQRPPPPAHPPNGKSVPNGKAVPPSPGNGSLSAPPAPDRAPVKRNRTEALQATAPVAQ